MIYMDLVLDDGAYEPERGHKVDAGYDLRTPMEVVVPAHGSAVIDLGVHMGIPRGYFGKLESKSGLNVRNSVVSLGGVIDSGYTGSIVAKLYNLGDEDYVFHKGDKVVQIIIQACNDVKFNLKDHLNDTERGGGGFGSTGR